MEENNWSGHDLTMIAHREVFLHKPAIMARAEARLKELERAMAKELAATGPALPPNTKTAEGQLVRGENHKGFPFLSLDIPQFFTKTEYFTFRTLFWWGHYLGFSLILKGERLEQYLNRLLKEKANPDWADIHLAIAPTPWEWAWNDECFKNVADTPDKELAAAVEEIEYIKLVRFFPVEDARFASLDWAEAGVKAWRDFSSVGVK